MVPPRVDSMSKRDRYERANIRGGLGVRKRLSEESLRETYRINGVQTGSVVVRAHDKYFGDFSKGYDIGVLVRKTALSVTIHWYGEDEATVYSQGDARYETDRGRWKFLGALQGNPLDPSNPLVDALTMLRPNARIEASPDSTPPTEETEVTQEMSNAAAERAAAKKALAKGELKERDLYTAKQVATRCGTDSKTMRKFFRSSHSTVDPVGQGGRYEFDAKDLPKIKQEFNAWQTKAKARRSTPKPKPELVSKDLSESELEAASQEVVEQEVDHFNEVISQHPEIDDHEPTPEELAELENLELDDLDED